MIENVETCQVFASQSVSQPCDDDDLSPILGQVEVTGFRCARLSNGPPVHENTPRCEEYRQKPVSLGSSEARTLPNADQTTGSPRKSV